MQYYRFDQNGHFLEPVIAEFGDQLPANITATPPPQPCYLPRWAGDAWVEDAPMPTDAPPDGHTWQWDSEGQEWQTVPVQTAPDPLQQMADLLAQHPELLDQLINQT